MFYRHHFSNNKIWGLHIPYHLPNEKISSEKENNLCATRFLSFVAAGNESENIRTNGVPFLQIAQSKEIKMASLK